MTNLIEQLINMLIHPIKSTEVIMAFSSIFLTMLSLPHVLPDLDTISKLIHYDEVHYAVLAINSLIVFVLGNLWRYLQYRYKLWRKK